MVPFGRARASWKISLSPSQDDRSSGFPSRLHEPPTCATTMTIAAPRRRRSFAAVMTDGASGRARRPAKFAGNVMNAVPAFARPMMPTFTSPTSAMCVPPKLGQAGGAPVASSTRFAARNGKCASAARALSAPRGSSPGARGDVAGPTGPKSNSWLPTAAASYSSALYARTTLRPRSGSIPASPGTCRPRRRARRRRRLRTASRRRLAT